MDLVSIIIICLALAVVINVFLKRFHIPTIIGYIATGAIISAAFNLSHNADLLHIAEFGIVFLMFTIGLEFSIEHLKSMKTEVFLNGFLQVMITGGIFSLIGEHLVGLDKKTAIVVGAGLALSSTAIVLKIYNENGNINTIFGRKSLGILLFQDIAVIPILLMITIFTKEGVALSELLQETFISAAIVLAILYVIGKFVLNKVLEVVTQTDSSEIFITTILFLVIGASYLAYIFGFSFSLGAFIAGMMIAETRFKYQIEADLVPFRDILLGVFFITVGLQINFTAIAESYLYILLALVVIIAIKALVIYIVISRTSDKRPALKTALSLFQVGEFSLAVFELARVNNLIDEQLTQILVVTVVISMVITPFILRNISNIVDRLISEPVVDIPIRSTGFHNHIVVCGYGKLGQHIALILKKMNMTYLVIEHDAKLVRLGKDRGEPVFFGNAAQKSILEKAGICDAAAVIVAIKNEERLRLISEILHSLKANMNIIVRVEDHEEKDLISDLKINHILNANDVLAQMLVNEALVCKVGDEEDYSI